MASNRSCSPKLKKHAFCDHCQVSWIFNYRHRQQFYDSKTSTWLVEADGTDSSKSSSMSSAESDGEEVFETSSRAEDHAWYC